MIDFHLHLDGSLSKEDLKILSRMSGIDEKEVDTARISVDENCTSLSDYLECFDFPNRVLQSKETLTHAAYLLCKRLSEQGLIYVEIRFAPQLSTAKGLSIKEASIAVIEGLEKATKDFGIESQAILCLMRGGPKDKNLETVRVGKELLGKGVCAIDLAGGEAVFPTKDYEEEFALAKSLGIPFTIHAGEADGPASVWKALEFGASRIGHGIHSIEDDKLIKHLAENRIPLEVCPTSEVDTHCIPSYDKLPLREFMNKGIVVSIATDDMTVSNIDLRTEYKKLRETFNLSKEEEWTLIENGFKAAFLDEFSKARLIKRAKAIYEERGF